MLWLLLLPAALAYETDTLTDRDQPLPDVSQALDAHAEKVVRDSIAWVNARSECKESPEQMQRLLGKAIDARLSPQEIVTDRKGLARLGFDRYSAWIEMGGAPHRNFNDRRDIYGDISLGQSPFLKLTGVCSTVRIGDVLLGTDKLDHFFVQGYEAWRRSHFGAFPQRAIEWATHTELTTFGLETSLTFSYADLKADYDGMEFYDTLLDPDRGVARIGANGCLQPTHPFRWENWVTWEYDETENPNVYAPHAQAGVTRHLEAHRDAYCASFHRWDTPEFEQHLQQALRSRPPYAAVDAPERTDPFDLDDLCADWTPGLTARTVGTRRTRGAHRTHPSRGRRGRSASVAPS